MGTNISAVIVSTSSQKSRLEGYLEVGDIELTKDEVKEIDHAGHKGQLWEERKEKSKSAARYAVAVVAAGYLGYRALF